VVARCGTTVRDANFNPDHVLTLRTRNSAAYKGIYALLMQSGGRESLIDQPMKLRQLRGKKIDIPHIFPKAWCRAQSNKIEAKRMDCIVKKTAISAPLIALSVALLLQKTWPPSSGGVASRRKRLIGFSQHI
jgi:hypothetical protein